jgi:hypothetical protein
MSYTPETISNNPSANYYHCRLEKQMADILANQGQLRIMLHHTTQQYKHLQACLLTVAHRQNSFEQRILATFELAPESAEATAMKSEFELLQNGQLLNCQKAL